MSGNTSELRRAIMARVADVDAVKIAETGPFNVRITIVPNSKADFATLKARIERVLHYVGIAGVGYHIEEGSISAETGAANIPSRLQVAGYDTDPTVSGIMEALVRLVPRLARLALEERTESLQVLVAQDDGSAPAPFIEECRRALEAIKYTGLRFEIAPFSANDHRNALINAGFHVPRRESRINRLTEEHDDQYATRLKKLVNGAPPEQIRLIDSLSGSKVLCTSALRGQAPLACFLPIYDHVYTMLPPQDVQPGVDYFNHFFDLTESEFIDYCRLGKLIPVFKFSLGSYPEKVAKLFLEDPSLPFLQPRELDYVAARYAWDQSRHIRFLSANRKLTEELHLALEELDKLSFDTDARLQSSFISSLLHGVERFEGTMWRNGHLALPHFSPAIVGAQALALLPRSPSGDMAMIDGFSAIHNIALAQAFQASLHTKLVLAEPMLSYAASFFRPMREVHSSAFSDQLNEVIRAFDIAHAKIPAKDYVEIFDAPETKRLRTLVTDVLKTGSDPAKDSEIRERVQTFNAGVRKLARNAVESSSVDVAGDLVAGAQASAGHSALINLLSKLLGLKTVTRVAGMVAKRAIEDTVLGGQLDRVRGVINGVPSQSIRLYRIRSKLQRR